MTATIQNAANRRHNPGRASSTRRMAAAATALSLVLGASAPLSAGPDAAALGWVPAEAAVVGQFDMALLRTHALMAPVWEGLAASPAARHLDRFADKTGIDPRQNIDRLVFFGLAEPKAGGAAIVEGTFDTDTLQFFLDDTLGVEREDWNGQAVYTYHEGKADREKAVLLIGPGRALVGDRDAVRLAAAAQRGQIPALTGDAHELALWQSVIGRPHSVLTAVAFPDPTRIKDAVLQQLKEATLTVQLDEALRMEFLSVWPNADLATSASEWAKATVRLHRQAQPEPPEAWRPLADAVADSLSIAADGAVASVRVEVPTSLIEERMRACAAQH